MAAVCEIWGLHIEYPENWTLDIVSGNPDDLSAGETRPPATIDWAGWDPGDPQIDRQVVISGLGTAFWQLSRHPAETPLETLFDEVLAALRSEYRELEVEPARERIERLAWEGYDVNFYCLDLTVTALLRGFPTPAAVYVMLCQAEDREWPLAGQVFQAMNVTLARSLSAAPPQG